MKQSKSGEITDWSNPIKLDEELLKKGLERLEKNLEESTLRLLTRPTKVAYNPNTPLFPKGLQKIVDKHVHGWVKEIGYER
tara:strand:+ start:303 stop:545 length:243 start_codon:yes stop_codon:yes gene_type:complete